ncbi:MAG TPA: hypothetical protein DCR55_17065 [Lentisphaeria bacterium]|nr:hypothetical protein [Lentisphaeria bacterium]
MPRKRPRKRTETMSRPDITPLVDLTFILLIVFMITAPVLENAMDVKAPALNNPRITESHTVISITAAGEYRWNGEMLSLAALQAQLTQLAETTPAAVIYLRADSVRQYGDVMAVMRLIRSTGITEVSLVTLPES